MLSSSIRGPSLEIHSPPSTAIVPLFHILGTKRPHIRVTRARMWYDSYVSATRSILTERETIPFTFSRKVALYTDHLLLDNFIVIGEKHSEIRLYTGNEDNFMQSPKSTAFR